MIFQITCELYFQGCSVLYPPPKNFSTTKQLPPEESGDSLRFSRRLQRALSPMGLLQGRRLQKWPGLQGGISRTLIAGRRFFSCRLQGYVIRSDTFFWAVRPPLHTRGRTKSSDRFSKSCNMKVFIVLEYNEQSGFKPFWFVKQFQHLWGRIGSTKAGPTGPPKKFPPRTCFHTLLASRGDCEEFYGW